MTEQAAAARCTPKLLAVITDREEILRLQAIFREKHLHFQYMFNAKGTASSEILETFGLTAGEKIVCLCVQAKIKTADLLRTISDRLEFVKPGNGIAFVVPISGVTGVMSSAFLEEEQSEKSERLKELMDREMEKGNETAQYELIVSVVNQGFSEVLMDAAKAAGATGGTIIHARRTGVLDEVKFFGVSLQEDKEVVAIVTQKCRKKELMQAITKACGIETDAKGIVFSLSVEHLEGLEFEPCEDE